MDEGYRADIGEEFQAAVRSPEWQAALIVYEKYRRKFKLDHNQLMQLREHVVKFADERRAAGKAVGKDLLTQEASAYCKKEWTPSSH